MGIAPCHAGEPPIVERRRPVVRGDLLRLCLPHVCGAVGNRHPRWALRGTPNALFAVDRYSLFWAIDGLGYICMGFSTLFAAGAFERNEIWTRHFFVANGLFTSVIAFIYFYPVFSVQLLLLGTPWILTAPGSILLLAFRFARERRGVQNGLCYGADAPAQARTGTIRIAACRQPFRPRFCHRRCERYDRIVRQRTGRGARRWRYCWLRYWLPSS